MATVHKTIRYDKELYKFYTQVSKASGIPRDRLVRFAMASYRPVLEAKYPDAKFITVEK